MTVVISISQTFYPFAVSAETRPRSACREDEVRASSTSVSRELNYCIDAKSQAGPARVSQKKMRVQNLNVFSSSSVNVFQEKAGVSEVNHGLHSMTAYTSESAQTDASPCTTASGFNVCKHGVEDTVAANFLPFGAKVKIPDLFGERVFVVRDRMNSRYSERVDVWMKDRSDAIQFGVRSARLVVLK